MDAKFVARRHIDDGLEQTGMLRGDESPRACAVAPRALKELVDGND